MHAYDRTMLTRLGFADPDKKNPTHDLACQYVAENAASILDQVVQLKPQPIDVTNDGARYVGARTLSVQARKPVLEQAISKGQYQYKTTIGFIDVVLPYDIMSEDHGEYQFSWTYQTLADHLDSSRDTLRWHTPYHDCSWCRNHSLSLRDTYLHEVVQPLHERLRTITSEAQIADLKNRPILYTGAYEGSSTLSRGALIIEVKTTPTGVGEILRQINLYREYTDYITFDHVKDYRGKFECRWLLTALFPLKPIDVEALQREGVECVRLGEKFKTWCAQQQQSDHQTKEI